ncbi:hypothetical protein D3C87_1820270 [compost metagenome]
MVDYFQRFRNPCHRLRRNTLKSQAQTYNNLQVELQDLNVTNIDKYGTSACAGEFPTQTKDCSTNQVFSPVYQIGLLAAFQGTVAALHPSP